MDFLQKLDILLEQSGLNKNTLSKTSGISYTTIDGWYKKGYENIRLSTLRELSDFFDVSLDFWVDSKKTISKNQCENDKYKQMLLTNYQHLNAEGQKKLVEYSDDLVSSGKYEQKESGNKAM